MLTTLLNRYLMLDPDSLNRIKPLIGKVVAIKIQPPGFILYFRGEEDQLTLLSAWDGVVDTTITGGPISLAQMNVSPTSPLKQLMSGNVVITGDTEIGQIFQSVLHELDIPWQRHLAGVVGDAMAHQMSQAVRGFRQWGSESSRSMQANITEYLQEEIGQLPPREAVRDFLSDVDELRMAGDRLMTRVERLTKTAQS